MKNLPLDIINIIYNFIDVNNCELDYFYRVGYNYTFYPQKYKHKKLQTENIY